MDALIKRRITIFSEFGKIARNLCNGSMGE